MLSAVAAVTDKNDSSSYFVYGGNRNGVVHSSFQVMSMFLLQLTVLVFVTSYEYY